MVEFTLNDTFTPKASSLCLSVAVRCCRRIAPQLVVRPRRVRHTTLHRAATAPRATSAPRTAFIEQLIAARASLHAFLWDGAAGVLRRWHGKLVKECIEKADEETLDKKFKLRK